MNNDNNNIHIGKLILQKLKEEERSVAWLAEKIYTDPSNLRKRLKKKSMDTELLVHISKILNYNFFNYYKDY
jgi:hypothetical protein